ncbi:solute carrier family 22 member 7-like isoform X2 [Ornithodoros turicata]|uniref:solute carrier family 22 member 7-like isoform X2 n=1 Tax=Ornithodoros turicata TaxID=34597 RepID=UPI003139AC12
MHSRSPAVCRTGGDTASPTEFFSECSVFADAIAASPPCDYRRTTEYPVPVGTPSTDGRETTSFEPQQARSTALPTLSKEKRRVGSHKARKRTRTSPELRHVPQSEPRSSPDEYLTCTYESPNGRDAPQKHEEGPAKPRSISPVSGSEPYHSCDEPSTPRKAHMEPRAFHTQDKPQEPSVVPVVLQSAPTVSKTPSKHDQSASAVMTPSSTSVPSSTQRSKTRVTMQCPDPEATERIMSSIAQHKEFSRRFSVRSASITDVEQEYRDGGRDELADMLGTHGPYQRNTFNFSLLVAFVLPFQAMIPQILEAEVDYWCARPTKNISTDLWKEQMIPKENGEYSKCEMFVSLENGSKATTSCSSWEFGVASSGFTIIQEFELVCEKAWMVPMSSSAFLVGGLCALLIAGPISDKYGRKPVAHTCVVTAEVAAVLIIFCRVVSAFLAMRFLLGAAMTTLFTTSVVLVVEVMSPEMRSIYGIGVLMGQSVGDVVMASLSWLGISWHSVQILGLIPSFMMLRAYYNITESPRWLIAKGHIESAETIILHAALMNEENTLEVRKLWARMKRDIDKDAAVEGQGGSSRDFLSLRERWKDAIILYYCATAISFAYFTVTIRLRKLSFFPNSLLIFTSIFEVASELSAIVFVARLGRRTTEATSLCCAGIACLTASLLSDEVRVISVGLTMAAVTFINSAYCIIWLYTAEIYPTVIRNTGLAVCYAFSTFGSALASLTEYLVYASVGRCSPFNSRRPRTRNLKTMSKGYSPSPGSL